MIGREEVTWVWLSWSPTSVCFSLKFLVFSLVKDSWGWLLASYLPSLRSCTSCQSFYSQNQYIVCFGSTLLLDLSVLRLTFLSEARFMAHSILISIVLHPKKCVLKNLKHVFQNPARSFAI